jgi:hypothetical protein
MVDIFVHKAIEMSLIQDDDIIEQVSRARANPPLGNTVLPRTPEAGPLWLNAEVLHCANDFFIEVCTAIEDEISRRRVVRECPAQLLNDPGARRVFCHTALKNAPPVMGNNEKAVKNAECQRRHGEKVHCCDYFPMIAQKCRPSLCRLWTSGSSPHPTQHSPLRNIEAKHHQLAMNARRTQVEFSATMRKMSSRNSLLTDFLPTRV